jgi:N-acetylmuramoyl-L-alanine amidase
MKTILSATSFVAVLGVIASATLSADTGYATDARPMSSQEIVVDPVMVEPTERPADTAEQDTAQPAAQHPGKAPEIIYVSQPVESQIIPDEVRPNGDAPAQNSGQNSGRTAASLAELVAQQPTTVTNAEMECLAGAVYFESKGEALAGQLAVAEVVINRAKSGRFPSTLCGVVYQKSQFSFVRGGKMPKIDKNGKAWRNAVAIAHIAMNEGWASPVKGSLFFHATYVSPGWRLTRTGTVGNHVFYR